LADRVIASAAGAVHDGGMEAGRALSTAVVALAFTQLGCSLLFLQEAPPPGVRPGKERDAPACTERNTLPVVDTVVAGVSGALVLGSLVSSDMPSPGHPTREERITRGVLLGTGALVGGVSAVSAMWGYYHTNECRRYLHPPEVERNPLSEPADPMPVSQ
jgi:hypothetical protein